MSTLTSNYNLVKPDQYDFYDVSIQNENMEIVDAALNEKAEKTEVEALKKSVSDGKTTVANAITAQGVTTATDATFATMATNIGTVATNKYNSGVSATKKGTATTAQVLSGATFTNSTTVGATGAMKNNGAVSQTLDCGGSYTIPTGYHNGSGKVTANSLASQTSATATASQILSGATAWVNGSKVTGSMTNRNTWTYAHDVINTGVSLGVIPQQGYYSGADPSVTTLTFETLASVLGVTADKLVSGSAICGVSGTAIVGRRYASGSGWTTTNLGAYYNVRPASAEWRTSSGINNYDILTINTGTGWYPSVVKVTFVSGNTYTAMIGQGQIEVQINCANSSFANTGYVNSTTPLINGTTVYIPFYFSNSSITSLTWEAWE